MTRAIDLRPHMDRLNTTAQELLAEKDAVLRRFWVPKPEDVRDALGASLERLSLYGIKENREIEPIDYYFDIVGAEISVLLSEEFDVVAHSTNRRTDALIAEWEPETTTVDVEILSRTGVPDLPRLVLGEDVENRWSQLLTLRCSSEGEAFRNWFHRNKSVAPADFNRALRQAYEAQPWISESHGGLLKWVLLGFLSLKAPPVSAALGFLQAVWPSHRGSHVREFLTGLDALAPSAGCVRT